MKAFGSGDHPEDRVNTMPAQRFQDRFLAERRIDPGVARARGYSPYRAGHPVDVYTVSPPMRMHKKGTRNPQWVGKFTAVDGMVMPKHGAFDHLAPIRPQLRPERAIIDRVWRHRHNDGHIEVLQLDLFHLDPEDEDTIILTQPESAWRVEAVMSQAGLAGHIEAKSRAEQHARVKTRRSVHVHLDLAKYAIAPEDNEKLRVGPREWEEWEWDDSKRLDVHPWSRTAFEARERGPVFFGIEGTPKNDAMLTWLLRNDLPPLVFNVPGVSMWRAPELALFALSYIVPAGNPVVIVPDADWAGNDEVIYHATNCARYLRKVCGIECVLIAAPPLADGKPLRDPRPGAKKDDTLKGADDYLGAGNDLLSMAVIDRQVDEGQFRDWAAEYRQRSRKTTAWEFDCKVARAMAETTGRRQTLRAASAISRAINGRPMTMEEARAKSVPEDDLLNPWLYPVWHAAVQEERAHIIANEKDVHDALARLSGHAFTPTGALPRWQDAAYWRPKAGGGWFKEPAGPSSRIEIVEMQERLRPIIGTPRPLRHALGLAIGLPEQV
jgi:hypothetical protein